MVRKIVWTRLSQDQKIEIFSYWNKKNQTNNYSKKLNELFNSAAELLAKFPFLGTITQVSNVRVKIVRNYLLIYRVTDATIFILSIWDSRKNPEDFERLIKLYQ